ncbi:hypothetical protein [Parabacteroides timonensis]|nr:hypothetical protein [Parabacteroides timonensis]
MNKKLTLLSTAMLSTTSSLTADERQFDFLGRICILKLLSLRLFE